MHMLPEGPLFSILSAAASRQGELLLQVLAPERWPFDPALLPAETALVGGAVRDALLGRLRQHPDLDLVVSGDAIALARSLASRCGGSCVVLDRERCMARLVLKGWTIDLARQIGTSLEADLMRRDYTINAIALPLAPGAELLDPSGGLVDLAAGQLRAISEANLLEDPLRLLRGVRLAAELNLQLEPPHPGLDRPPSPAAGGRRRRTGTGGAGPTGAGRGGRNRTDPGDPAGAAADLGRRGPGGLSAAGNPLPPRGPGAWTDDG